MFLRKSLAAKPFMITLPGTTSEPISAQNSRQKPHPRAPCTRSNPAWRLTFRSLGSPPTPSGTEARKLLNPEALLATSGLRLPDGSKAGTNHSGDSSMQCNKPVQYLSAGVALSFVG